MEQLSDFAWFLQVSEKLLITILLIRKNKYLIPNYQRKTKLMLGGADSP